MYVLEGHVFTHELFNKYVAPEQDVQLVDKTEHVVHIELQFIQILLHKF